MPGYLLHQGASVNCKHAGRAQPSAAFARVTLDKQPIATRAAAYTVSACPFNVAGAPSPCLNVLWTTTATRVFAGGVPVLLQDSQGICPPNGTGVDILATQTRVKGT
jgi:hypothetical protein